jgi:hypothetical protein
METLTKQMHSNLPGAVPGDLRATRAGVKKELSRNLNTRMRQRSPDVFGNWNDEEAEKAISQMISNWANSSGDGQPRSVAMQLAAQEEFGLVAEISHYGDDVIEAARALLAGPADDFVGILSLEGGPALPARDMVRSFLRAQYDYTQAWFKSQGVSELTLIRGAAYDDFIVAGASDLQLQPLSSFTTDWGTASEFGQTFHVVRVPADQVLSTFRTGFGCLVEEEVVVMSRPIRGWTFDVFDSDHEEIKSILARLGASGDDVDEWLTFATEAF